MNIIYVNKQTGIKYKKFPITSTNRNNIWVYNARYKTEPSFFSNQVINISLSLLVKQELKSVVVGGELL